MDFVIFVVIVAVIAFFVYKKDKGPKSTVTVSVDRDSDSVVSKAELKKLTKVQLIEMADKKNLNVKKSGSKADVINEIHSQLK
jgi:hypothetical protein